MALALRKIERNEDAAPKTPSVIGPILISIAFHLLLLPIASQFYRPSNTPSGPEVLKATRVKLAQPQLNQNMDITGQVVDLQDNRFESTTAPKDAQFLSDRNRTVDKEMQAKMTGINPGSGPAGEKRAQNPNPVEKKGGKGYDLSLDPKTLSELARKKSGAAGDGKAVAMAPNNYLPNIEFGDETLLSTREYVYATFFIRMKRQIEAYWRPLQWVSRYQETEDELVTAVAIDLNDKGYVEKVSVVNSSGIQLLDREAVESVKKGGPYLNPPEGLISSEDGKIHLGPIQFIVSLKQRF